MPLSVLRVLSLSIAVVLTSCAHEPRPYSPPKDIPLQDAPPGKAVVYLLRAPYDSLSIDISVANQKLAILGPSTYTAVALPPGTHSLVTKATSVFSAGGNVAPNFELTLKANERRFLNISGQTGKSPAVVGILPLAGGAIPLLLPEQNTANGSRSWKEVSEIDAQGLMSISKTVLPEPGAL